MGLGWRGIFSEVLGARTDRATVTQAFIVAVGCMASVSPEAWL